MNIGKVLIWTGVIGGVAVGGYFIAKAIKDAKDKKDKEDKKPVDTGNTGGATQAIPCTVIYPLQNGSGMGSRSCESEQVKKVQNYFNKLVPNNKMSVDGQWGGETDRYVQAILGLSSLTKAQYDSIAAGKMPTSKPENTPNTYSVIAAGTTYTITVKDPMDENVKSILVNLLISKVGLSNTEAKRKKLMKTKGTYLAAWYYYASKGYPTFFYSGYSFKTSTGERMKL